jgi:hypothetical protein
LKSKQQSFFLSGKRKEKQYKGEREKNETDE